MPCDFHQIASWKIRTAQVYALFSCDRGNNVAFWSAGEGKQSTKVDRWLDLSWMTEGWQTDKPEAFSFTFPNIAATSVRFMNIVGYSTMLAGCLTTKRLSTLAGVTRCTGWTVIGSIACGVGTGAWVVQKLTSNGRSAAGFVVKQQEWVEDS